MNDNTMLTTVDTETTLSHTSAWENMKAKLAKAFPIDWSSEGLAALCLTCAFVAFLGFWVENVFIAFTAGYMDNRNKILPFLVGYGLSILGLYLAFGTPKAPRIFGKDLSSDSNLLNAVTYFVIAFVCVCVGEILVGNLVEQTCGIVWWDYTDLPLNIGKYTAVPTSLGFAFLITLFMGCFFEPIKKLFGKINKKVLCRIAVAVAVLLLSEYLFSALRMFTTRELLEIWKITF